jgi:hypothetical protein
MSGSNGSGGNAGSRNQQQRRKQPGQGQGRRRGAKKSRAKQKPVDLWRPVPPLPEVEPIVPAGDPTALVRSLGEAPLSVPGAPAEITIATVVDRAAGLALALAAAGGLLAEPGEGDDGDEPGSG